MYVKKQPLPFYSSYIQAGFPSPSDDYLEKEIDLNDFLIKKRAATFLIRARGDSMKDAGIFDGSILVVDRSLDIKNGLICICYLNGEFTVKRFFDHQNYIELRPENKNFRSIKVYNLENFEVWGIVRAVINQTLI